MVPARRRIAILADLRYRGQAYEITTPWSALDDGAAPDWLAVEAVVAAFHELHLLRNGHNAPEDPVEIVTLRAVATGRLDRTEAAASEPPARTAGRTHRVYLRDGWRDVPLFDRAGIGPDPLHGPLIVQEDYTVLLIAPGWSLRAAPHGDLIAVRTQRSTA